MSKICSDIEQSKKLKELGLSPESADMYYQYVLPRSEKIKFNPEIGSPIESLKWYNSGYTFSNRRKPLSLEEFCIPAWSLSALLRVLKDYTLQTTTDGKVFIVSELGNKPYTLNSEECENEVDACVDMIIKLHEYDVL